MTAGRELVIGMDVTCDDTERVRKVLEAATEGVELLDDGKSYKVTVRVWTIDRPAAPTVETLDDTK